MCTWGFEHIQCVLCLFYLFAPRDRRNLLSQFMRPAMVWYLNLWIAHSAVFTPRLCGSTSCIIVFSFSRYSLTALEAIFSIILKTGLKYFLANYVMLSLNVATVDSSFSSLLVFQGWHCTTSSTSHKLLFFLWLIWLVIFCWIRCIWCCLSDSAPHNMEICDFILLLWLIGVDTDIFWWIPILFWFFWILWIPCFYIFVLPLSVARAESGRYICTALDVNLGHVENCLLSVAFITV